jgi:hypothetical protein
MWRYYPRMCLEGLRKTMKALNRIATLQAKIQYLVNFFFFQPHFVNCIGYIGSDSRMSVNYKLGGM